MKKKLLTIIGLLSLFVIVGCSNKTSNVPNSSSLLKNTEEIYGFEAITSINLLELAITSEQAPLSTNSCSYSIMKLGYEDSITDDEINEINKYLGIMEQMLGDDEPICVVDETSERPEYTNKMTISTKDINFNVHTYELYYNEFTISDDEIEDGLKDNDEDYEDEVESSLEGIMVYNGQEYDVFGKKEIEEDEIKVEFTSKIDENNWVNVMQKTEEDETKFEYTISEKGEVSKTEMKFEEEEDETKIELQFVQDENESKYEFKVEEEDGDSVIKIEIDNENTNLEAKVYIIEDPITGETTYEYKIKDSEKTYSKDRHIGQKDDDEDDDEEEDEKDEGIVVEEDSDKDENYDEETKKINNTAYQL